MLASALGCKLVAYISGCFASFGLLTYRPNTAVLTAHLMPKSSLWNFRTCLLQPCENYESLCRIAKSTWFFILSSVHLAFACRLSRGFGGDNRAKLHPVYCRLRAKIKSLKNKGNWFAVLRCKVSQLFRNEKKVLSFQGLAPISCLLIF